MPLKRLDRARASLPAGYQFGDAGKVTVNIAVRGVDVTAPLERDLAIEYPWRSYGYRQDGTIGVETPTNPLHLFTWNVIEGEQH